jgi:hypothetical protein
VGENVNKEVENVDPALKAGADDGGEDGLGASAEPSTVAAPSRRTRAPASLHFPPRNMPTIPAEHLPY